MGRSDKKIYTCLRIVVCIFIFAVFNILNADDSDLQNAQLDIFTVPKFNEETNKLEYILTGKKGKTEGAFIKITDTRVQIIGGDGYTVDAVITTPVALYDMVTGFVKGDDDIHLRSLNMDMDGIGFEANQVTDTLKVYKDVVIVSYPSDDPDREPVTIVKNKIQESSEADTGQSKNSEAVSDKANSMKNNNIKLLDSVNDSLDTQKNE